MERQNTNKTKISILALVNKYNLMIKNPEYTTQELSNVYNEIYSLIRRYNRDAYINSCLEGTGYKQRCELIDRRKDGHIYVVFEWSVL